MRSGTKAWGDAPAAAVTEDDDADGACGCKAGGSSLRFWPDIVQVVLVPGVAAIAVVAVEAAAAAVVASIRFRGPWPPSRHRAVARPPRGNNNAGNDDDCGAIDEGGEDEDGLI